MLITSVRALYCRPKHLSREWRRYSQSATRRYPGREIIVRAEVLGRGMGEMQIEDEPIERWWQTTREPKLELK
jgi:hypothetical protein